MSLPEEMKALRLVRRLGAFLFAFVELSFAG